MWYTLFPIHSNPEEIHQQERTEILSWFCLSLWTFVLRLLISLVGIWGCFVLNVQWIIKWTGFKIQCVLSSWYNPETLQCCTSCVGIRVGTAFKLDSWQIIKSCLFLIRVKWIYANQIEDVGGYIVSSRTWQMTLPFSEFNRLWALLNLILNRQTNLFATPLTIFSWFQMHSGVILPSAAWYMSFLFFCHCEGKLLINTCITSTVFNGLFLAIRFCSVATFHLQQRSFEFAETWQTWRSLCI